MSEPPSAEAPRRLLDRNGIRQCIRFEPISPPSRIPTFRPVNRYDRLEWAGTFGDMGTLMPFVIAYVSVLRLDPFSALFGFGVSMKVVGWFYRTPFPGRPMQPLKAAGAVATTQAAQSALITPGSVNGAGLKDDRKWSSMSGEGARVLDTSRLGRVISPPLKGGRDSSAGRAED